MRARPTSIIRAGALALVALGFTLTAGLASAEGGDKAAEKAARRTQLQLQNLQQQVQEAQAAKSKVEADKAAVDQQLLEQTQQLEQLKATLAKVNAKLKTSEAQRAELTTTVATLEKQLADAKRALALGGGGGAGSNEPEDVGGVKLIARVLDGVDGKGLRPVVEDFRKQIGSGVVALIGVTDGKAAVAVAVTDNLTGKLNAADLARAAVLAMGGQGAGGKADFAQGGAPDGSKGAEGLAAVRAAPAGCVFWVVCV